MAHLKRQEIPKSWPIERKGTKYFVLPNHGFEKAMPVLVVIRDILETANNRKEVKQAIHLRNILVNTKKIHDEKYAVVLFDTITFVPTKKSYRVEMNETGKFEVKEIKESEAGKKIAKIINKKMLNGKKLQLNLSDGRNVLSNEKGKVNDSVLINLKDNKIEKIVPFKEKANVLIFEGKHSGEKGVVEKINTEKKTADIEMKDKKVSVLIKQLMVVE